MTSAEIVGIDLGTTHTVVAHAAAAAPTPRVFPIRQLVSASELQELPLLSSALYAPLPGELPAEQDAEYIVGDYARRRGQEVPGRLIASAKSWLTYAAVDRSAAILPWGIEPNDALLRLSPVEASRRVLEHVRREYDLKFPGQRLEEQSIVLTVPASFDVVARSLTVTAAERAGLRVRLLEEPQAAFYDFMAAVGEEGVERLLLADRERATVLVCDVGGGTTDLTLIEVKRGAERRLEVERVAVGRHLLLGGDNIDLALAHRLEAAFVNPSEHLPPARFSQLVLACRRAKEQLLCENPPDSVEVTLARAGAALVGSTQSTSLSRELVEELVFSGFLPKVRRDETPVRGRAGLIAFGLPYEHDAAITRHLAQFFARHTQQQAPDALLLNGGMFRAPRVAKHLAEVVAAWSDRELLLLPHPDPDLSVARGAVAFGLALAGHGLRIGGGSPQGFYVGVEAQGQRRGLAVVPRGSREGERHRSTLRGLTLRVGQPVRFELYEPETRAADAPGALVALDDDEFEALPPLIASFERAETSQETELDVALEGELSAIGTLDLSCVELEPAGAEARRFGLAFDLRAKAPKEPSERPSAERGAPLGGQRLEQARALILRVFGKGRSDVKPRETKDFVRELERCLGERRSWTTEVNRSIVDAILPHHAARRRSEDHERVFWMLSGYCLRPGFGHPNDKARVGVLAPLFESGLSFPEQARSWQQFFIAFRRIAAGLSEHTQISARSLVDPHLAPASLKLKKSKQFRPLASEEMLEFAAFLERVPVELRMDLGAWVLDRTWSSRDPRLWGALGRIGARVPAFASVHHVVPPSAAERWLDHLLRERWQDVPTAPRAALELSRVTLDRARDVSESVRLEVAKRLQAVHSNPIWIQAVREFVAVDEQERADWFGEELPVGLHLREAEE